MNNLPEPNFIDRDADTITREWIDLYEQKTGKTLQPAQIERLLIDVGVYRENLLRIKMQETAKQNLVNYASYPVLDYLGELVGVTRLPAVKAKTVLRFSLSEPLTVEVGISKGAQVETKDGKIIFSTDDDAVIKVGEEFAEVAASAIIEGSIGNGYLASEISNLVTPVSYVDKAENVSESSGGADEETDEQLRQRIKEAPEQYSNAGSKGAYRFHTKSAHPSIIDVSAITKQAGVVEIYPLTKQGNPGSEIISTIQDYLSDEKVRPLTDQVLVSSPERVDFEIIANLILYTYADAESVQSQVNEKLEAYKADLKTKLGKDIVPTQIITLLNSIYGVYRVELTTPFYQELDTSQWANCTGYTVNIGGYSDG
nr:baseplate protein [bacterium]